MVDVLSPKHPLIVHLPLELIEELQTLAREKQWTVDEVVCEACLAYTEPYTWERCYKEDLKKNPDQRPIRFGIDGDELAPPQTPDKS